MVSCTECVHYHACESWVEYINDTLEYVNESTEGMKFAPSTFPIVAENKDEMCTHYEKAKVK